MQKPDIAFLLEGDNVNQTITVEGWVRTRRDSKDRRFFEINDGSTIHNLQAIIENNILPEETVKRLTPGASAALTGILAPSPAQGQAVELQVTAAHIYGDADPETYPLQKKRHSFEFLRDIAHLRPRTATFGAVNRVRNTLASAIHGFFQSRNFLYVQTPVITSSDCEGAGELFRVTTLNETPVSGDFSEDFFGTRTGLTVSGQLEGELLALALGKIYTFGPTFRAENSNTSRHLAEFWMVEPEIAFARLEENMETAEAMMRYVLAELLNRSSDDMAFFDARIQPGLSAMLEKLVNASFETMTYTEAVDRCASSGKKFEFPVSWGTDLQSEHERYLTDELVKGPVFIIDYPASIKPFYMKVNNDGTTVRAMDLLVPGVGEIIGGSQREDSLNVLVSRMKETGINPDEYWWYLDTRRYGSAPHAGFGLGFERLVQYATGMQNIRDVIPFPRTPKNARF